jgi:bacteriocin biosynthesis cyclodehydratase domain-containing protein
VPTKRPATRTRRLVLRPGVHVLRRSASELQIGLHPGRALVLPDRPSVRALLAGLSSPASAPPEGYDGGTVALLVEAGLLVDADALLPLVPHGPQGTPPDSVGRSDVAALAAQDGDAAARVLEARRAATVEVITCGGPEARAVADTLGTLLGRAGVAAHVRAPAPGTRKDGSSGRASTATTASAPAVLVTVGEPAREETDDWMRDGTPHLLLRLTESHAVVGPFVRPGQSACLRCIDAHHADVDPAWPLLVAQYASAVTREREDTVPEPVDAVLATLAAAWAAREMVSYAEGREPATTSATIRLDPHLTALETQTWPRHPACGCSWS